MDDGLRRTHSDCSLSSLSAVIHCHPQCNAEYHLCPLERRVALGPLPERHQPRHLVLGQPDLPPPEGVRVHVPHAEVGGAAAVGLLLHAVPGLDAVVVVVGVVGGPGLGGGDRGATAAWKGERERLHNHLFLVLFCRNCKDSSTLAVP